MVPPHRPAQVLLESGLADTETGIRVDYDTLKTKWDNVYAIGDCADMPASRPVASHIKKPTCSLIISPSRLRVKEGPSISGCIPYDCSHSAQDAPPQIEPFIPPAGHHSASPSREPGDRLGLFIGPRSVSRNGGCGDISKGTIRQSSVKKSFQSALPSKFLT